MNNLIEDLIKNLKEGKSQLLDFEELMSRYSKREEDKIQEHLKELQDVVILQYEREEFGFRILINDMERLKELIEIE